MRPQGFPPAVRLRKRQDFLRVQRTGRKRHVKHFMVVVQTRPSDDPTIALPSRIGITVTKRIGSAVVRNRLKRRVREAFRRVRAGLPDGLDLVFIAKQGAARATWREIVGDVDDVGARLGAARG